MAILLKAIPSSEKCFWDEDFAAKPTFTKGSVLGGEDYFFELAYTSDDPKHVPKASMKMEVISPIADLLTIQTVHQVPNMYPVLLPALEAKDPNYLRTKPGLYPDLLRPFDPATTPVFIPYGELRSMLITVSVPKGYPAGEYPITFRLTPSWDETIEPVETTATVKVIGVDLPEVEFKLTQWFHCDCIADYYEIEIFSEKHWEYIEKFMVTAVKNGLNTILTPIFTPPLDTEIGGERPTVQLIDVTKTDDGWEFGFDKLERWVKLCNKVGFKYFEVAHLYTQWGANHAPKIMGKVNGEYVKLFGWETDALSDEYRTFLRALLTAFIEKMKSLDGADKRCLFHISDEPNLDHLEQYTKVKAQVADILEDYVIMDALSNYEFYKTGVLDNPIPGNDHVDEFIAEGVPHLWTYYCCGQAVDVSNRMLAMPMGRTRVIGSQFWKYNIEGFLQWGYNFYYSQNSVHKVNPFECTDGDYFVPSGDCFSVYPGDGGEPLETLRIKAFLQALNDRRAMNLAESLCGREAVLSTMEEGLDYSITFQKYPTDLDYSDKLREKINTMIENATK